MKEKRFVSLQMVARILMLSVPLPEDQCCSKCGCTDRKIVRHHDDYLRPMTVRLLCGSCHGIWHFKNGPGKNRDVIVCVKPGWQAPYIRKFRQMRKEEWRRGAKEFDEYWRTRQRAIAGTLEAAK